MFHLNPSEILKDLEESGIKLRVDSGKLMAAPASHLSMEQKQKIREHKDNLMRLLNGNKCPKGHTLDEKRCCWRCFWRRCECGRETGSAFIATCIFCDLQLKVRSDQGGIV